MKNKNGITLIALVITIVVLLILASIALSTIIGEDGIIANASRSKEETRTTRLEEELKLKYASEKISFKTGSDDSYLTDVTSFGNGRDENGTFNIVKYKDNNFKVYFNEENNNVIDVKYFDLKELDIYNCDEMLEFAQRVNNGENFSNYIVRLKNDLDFDGADWDTIGYSALRANEEYDDAYFAGIFDGENHTISNLNITDARHEAGIFGNNQGTIKNLNVINLSIIKSSSYVLYVGGIAATNSGSIENCSATVQISTISTSSNFSTYVGAIVGSNSGIISESVGKGELETGGMFVNIGGISGSNDDTIKKCINESTVIINENGYAFQSNTGVAGGITGENRGHIYQCKNIGEIRGYNYYIAGIAGENLFSAVIEECINSGNLSTNFEKNLNQSYAPCLAGICGYNWKATIKNSYNTGNIIIDSAYSGWMIAGIVSSDTEGETKNCYSIGKISGERRSAAVGEVSVDSNCYYDSDTSVATDTNATPVTSADLKSNSMIEKLGNAYKKNPSGGYPLLNWE